MRGTHPDLHISPRTGRPKTRTVGQIVGLGSGKEFGVHNSSLCNLRRGLVERLFFVEGKDGLEPPPQPLPNQFDNLSYFRKRVHAILGLHSPITHDQFVGLYQGRRKTIYQNAVASLDSLPVSRKDSFLSTFVKAEKIPLYKKPDPAPRIIQPRNPRYNVEVGCYLKPYEHHLYRAIDHVFGGPTIIKGYTVDEIGTIVAEAWEGFHKPVAIGFDMKRFDQHVSVDALKFEHSVYLQSFSHDPKLARLLSWQLQNKGYANVPEGRIKYTREGCRMSGDVNTAMGNCLLACSMTHFLLKSIKFRLLNNGDDCVVITDSCNTQFVLEALPRFLEFGFQCIGEDPVYTIEHLEFCNLKPLHLGYGKFTMIRNPDVSLSKDTYCVSGWSTTKEAVHWLSAIGQCGEAITRGVPVLQEYYRALTRNFRSDWLNKNHHKLDSGFYRLALKGSARWDTHITEHCRYSFYIMTGIVPDAQVALEQKLAALEFTAEWDPVGLYDSTNNYEQFF